MPAAVPLRPPPAPAPRSPERERLAAAITRYNAVTLAVDRVAAAQSQTAEARLDRFLAIERAEAALADAHAGEPLRRTAALLGEAPDGSLSVPDAQRAVAAAKDIYEAAKADEVLLQQAASDAGTRLDYARMDRNTAVAAALQASPELGRLFAQLEEARDRVEAIKGALRALGPVLTSRQSNILALVPDRRDDGPTADAWRASLAALERDPDASLPGISDEPPPAPAVA